VTNNRENLSSVAQRTRRNIMTAGVVLASAAVANLATTRRGAASNGHENDSKCLLSGTTIQTADGVCKVEDLASGDLLPTMFGGMRPIQWIARYPLKKSNPSKPWVKDALPVRVARSALAPDVPHTDLYVTSGHALFIDGLLVPVGDLINGTSITRDECDCDELEYFNIKVEGHDVIYAEGAPVETLLEVDEFAVNFAEYFRRYGVPETQETPCAPLVTYGGGRGEFKSRIRSAMSPWLDRREPLDVIRDRLEERGIALSRPFETVR
jgi:hypothetical protein